MILHKINYVVVEDSDAFYRLNLPDLNDYYIVDLHKILVNTSLVASILIQNKDRFIVTNLQPATREAIQVLGIDKVINIKENMKEAISEFIYLTNRRQYQK